MTLYQVKDWKDHFEGAKSRTYSNKSSCQMPTKHGLGYKRLVKRENGAALFGAWCALIQVLSRHSKEREGYCTDTGRSDGKPYTDTDLEMMTDIPAAVFKELLQVAASRDVEWLRILQGTTRIPQGTHADTTSDNGTIYSDLDSDLDSDSDLDLGATSAKPTQPKPSRVKLADDEDWLKEIREIYKPLGVDVDRELAKARAWLLTPKGRNRKLTRQFFGNWLSKCDRAMEEGQQNATNPHGHRGMQEQIEIPVY